MTAEPQPAPGRADFALKPTLTGERAVLRPFTAEDAPTMARILAYPEVTHFTGAPTRPLTTEVLHSWYASRSEQTDRLDLAVTDRTTGQLLGESVLFDWDEPNRSCTFRILLGPAGRGRGVGTETVRLTLAHAFGHLRLHRVRLGAFAFNERALHVYRTAGFVTERVHREATLRDGTPHDEVTMAVLARDWAGHQGYPAGFSARAR
ncbi:GNAT family N-acetyltransferase [Streptomyces sp. NPDC058045]|uniref:GNAT family N-acetyltransferase n=1 Tax=Streptomyces sp. NPDC058045 TaxID=3346311 RepID=UPI0036E259F3